MPRLLGPLPRRPPWANLSLWKRMIPSLRIPGPPNGRGAELWRTPRPDSGLVRTLGRNGGWIGRTGQLVNASASFRLVSRIRRGPITTRRRRATLSALRHPIAGWRSYDITSPTYTPRNPPKALFTRCAFDGSPPIHTPVSVTDDPFAARLEALGRGTFPCVKSDCPTAGRNWEPVRLKPPTKFGECRITRRKRTECRPLLQPYAK